MVIKKNLALITIALALSSCAGGSSQGVISDDSSTKDREMHNHSVYTNGVPFADSLWERPEFFYDESLDNEGCKAVFIRSDYNDQESYAFAYLGLPEGELDNNKAVLLIHGGGGTAYHEWVNAWVNKGYVALAIDLEGHIPNKDGKITDVPANLYHQSTYSAPHNQNMGDENSDITKTWLHYACRTAIIANSFLHNLEGVNVQQVGVSGVSWGGYITSIITGYDDRFAFSAPHYITVGQKESNTPLSALLKAHPSFEVFDNPEPLMLSNTPYNLIVSDADQWANIIDDSEVVHSTNNGQVSIIYGFLHSHYHSMVQPESYAFADAVLKGKYKADMTWKGEELTISTDYQIRYLAVVSTNEETITSTSKWYAKEVDMNSYKNGKVTVNPRNDATYFYLSFADENGAIHSSPIQKVSN